MENGDIHFEDQPVVDIRSGRALGLESLARTTLHIAVNVSPLQLRRDQFVEDLLDLVAQHHADPSLLRVEVTEGIFMDAAATTPTSCTCPDGRPGAGDLALCATRPPPRLFPTRGPGWSVRAGEGPGPGTGRAPATSCMRS